MALPIAAIVCIVLACWVLLVLILFAVYQILKTRGSCKCDCAPCGKEERGGCCECCISLSDSCNCCTPSINGCLNKICPGKKKVSCVDLLLCQCFASDGEESCCLKILPSCGCCGEGCCSCCVDCEAVVCCCLEIRLVSSKSEEGHASTKMARKYSPEQPKSAENKNVKKAAVQHNMGDDDEVDDQNESRRPLPNSPPTSARSVSQLILIPKTDSGNKTKVKKRAVKKMIKSRSIDLGTATSSGNKRTSIQSGKKKIPMRTLPDTPRAANGLTKSQKSKGTSCESTVSEGDDSDSEGELKEVVIKQQNIPLHTVNSDCVVRAMSMGSLHSESHVSFSLSDIGTSHRSVDGDSVGNSSCLLLPSGYDVNSVNNGLMSHRQYGAESQISFKNYTETTEYLKTLGYNQQSGVTSSSKRPLPVPSSR